MKEYISNRHEFTTRTPEGEIHRLRFQHHMEVLDLILLWGDEEFLDTFALDLLHAANHGLKAFIDCTFKNALERDHIYQTSLTIKVLMGNATPRQFMRVFPITFCFESGKNEIKDCYPILAKIDQMDSDESLGDEIGPFLLDYPNEDIRRFNEMDAIVMDDYNRAHKECHEIKPL